MASTERLYYTDSYLRDFEAAVVDLADDGRRVYLDRTAFYPTSGGQPHDTGRLNGIQITDVVDEAERIGHLLAQPMTGTKAVGQLDWPRRFDHMQQHTGQHLLSAVLNDLYGYATVGVHFGPESSTVDLDGPSFNQDQIGKVEDSCNEVVVGNRPVEVSFEEAERAIGLRKASERTGNLRVVTIRNLDRSACGGTHVRATGEIGPILIGKVERVRKGTRVEFCCGTRAVRRAGADHALLSRLAGDFSASTEELPALINNLRGEVKEAHAARRSLETQLDGFRARELYLAAEPDATGIRRIVIRQERGSLEGLRGVAQAFASMPLAIFVGATASPPALVLATSTDSGVDAAGVLKGLLASVGGRGGGSATLAQGTVPGKAELEAVVASIGGRVEGLKSKV
jgi:alanyl-tRNA synthetase